MQSLKFLSAAQNKIESLPQVSVAGGTLRRKKKGKAGSGGAVVGALGSFRNPLHRRETEVSLYNCPWLEEVQLQDNRLTSLPAAIFTLESLSSLDVSNNKLQGPNSIG